MRTVLVIAGICAVLAGLFEIGFGIPIQEFSLGNTLILAGVMMLCTGMILLGIWVAVRELRAIGRQQGVAAPAEPRIRPALPVAAPGSGGVSPAEDGGFRFARDHRPRQGAASSQLRESEGEPTSSWHEHEEPSSRDREHQDFPAVAEPAEATSAPKPRRNMLFSSTLRRDRELAKARMGETSTPEARSEVAAIHPASEPIEEPVATFEDTWPKSERSKTAELPLGRTARAPSTFADPSADSAGDDYHSPDAHGEEAPPITVIKSGVVDGMAYSLYSDGSIEAQMPEGMMRFASIDELRAHLDQRP